MDLAFIRRTGHAFDLAPAGRSPRTRAGPAPPSGDRGATRAGCVRRMCARALLLLAVTPATAQNSAKPWVTLRAHAAEVVEGEPIRFSVQVPPPTPPPPVRLSGTIRGGHVAGYPAGSAHDGLLETLEFAASRQRSNAVLTYRTTDDAVQEQTER